MHRDEATTCNKKAFGYKNHLLERLNEQRLSASSLCDMSIHVESVEFGVHKCLMIASSDFFAAMFNSGMAEVQTGLVHIDDDVDPNIFRVFLKFLYVGDLKSFKGKEQLFALADKYQVYLLIPTMISKSVPT